MSENTNNPEVVYHYTTMGTMMKIAETATIWATSIGYLNDVSEGDYFIKLVRERIPQYRTANLVEPPTLFDEFLNSPATESVELRPFVASFSQDGDSLPQWRSYCPNGNGVAIGFKVDCLKHSFVTVAGEGQQPSMMTPRFVKVDYLDSMTPESLDFEITRATKWAMELSPYLSGTTKGMEFKIIMQVLTCAKKHFSFSNEREFRLVLDAVSNSTDSLEFRLVRSTLVPYVPLGIPRKHSHAPAMGNTTPEGLLLSERILAQIAKRLGGRWDFIDRVVIGPSPNKDLSKTAVDLFFNKMNMNVEVVSSDIPYRDW